VARECELVPTGTNRPGRIPDSEWQPTPDDLEVLARGMAAIREHSSEYLLEVLNTFHHKRGQLQGPQLQLRQTSETLDQET
jgi:hypothetical protein